MHVFTQFAECTSIANKVGLQQKKFVTTDNKVYVNIVQEPLFIFEGRILLR
jgi:hypothetical protein